MLILDEYFRFPINYKKYKWKYLMSKLKTSIYVLIRFNSGSMLRDYNRRENYVARKKKRSYDFYF